MPIIAHGSLDFISRSPDQTKRLGYRLGQLLTRNMTICLAGELGAGKTTFVAGIGEGWGAQQRITSPTFVIVHQHDRAADQQSLHHIDAYRIESAGDAASIGLDDIWEAGGVVIIEWPQHIENWLPPEYLWIDFLFDDDNILNRRMIFRAEGTRHQDLLDAFRQAAFGG